MKSAFKPITKSQYSINAKKRIKNKFTIIAITFMLSCAALQSINWITPLAIKVLALFTGILMIYVLIDEKLLSFREVDDTMLDKVIKENNYDDSIIQTIDEIKKTRKLYVFDLKSIKSSLKQK